MGWMSRKLGKDKQQQQMVEESRNRAPGKGVQYHPGLIDTYITEHRKLETLFTDVGKSAKSGDYAGALKALTEFKTTLESHLLSENVRFYAYVEQQMKGDRENAMLIKSFRTEMNDIARQVVRFVRKWRESGVDQATVTDFLNEYRSVGQVLQRRMEAEERDLYTLYMPPA